PALRQRPSRRPRFAGLAGPVNPWSSHGRKRSLFLLENSLRTVEDKDDEQAPDDYEANRRYGPLGLTREKVFEPTRCPITPIEKKRTEDDPAIISTSAQNHHDINPEGGQRVELI